MTIHHRKSAALAIDGKPERHLMHGQDSTIDIDDIAIWLDHYLREHGAPGVTIHADMTLAQAGLDAAGCRTLLSAFEYRYSVSIAAPAEGWLSSVRACSEFLLAQINTAAPSALETTAYAGTRHMVRTLISTR